MRKWSELNFVMMEFKVYLEMISLSGTPVSQIHGDGGTGYSTTYSCRGQEIHLHTRRLIDGNGVPTFEVRVQLMPRELESTNEEVER